MVMPALHGARIVTTLSDSSFLAIVLDGGVLLVSVYLPDAGKSDYMFESAVESIASCMHLARAQHGVRWYVLVGDWNVSLHSAGGEFEGVLGPHWEGEGPYSERQDTIMQFCACFNLVHAASHVQGDLADQWTREAWGVNPKRTALDHAFVSRGMNIERWSLWPGTAFVRDKRRVWGDHRPCLLVLGAGSTGTPMLQMDAPAPRSYTGWQLLEPSSLRLLQRSLQRWAASCVATPSADIVSRCVLELCTSVPHTTLAERRSRHVPPPVELRAVRSRRRSLDRGTAELVECRREEKRLVRAWAAAKLAIGGGPKQARRRDSWKSVSFLTFTKGGEPTSDRAVWRRELSQHWRDRFEDPLDSHVAQEALREKLWRDAGHEPLIFSLGEMVCALASAKPGSAGGMDGVVADMLHVLPLSVVEVIRSVFNSRFADSIHGPVRVDSWRQFLATWIRKDQESDLLASFRPIVQSSVFFKWIERGILGDNPERLLLHRMSMWAFRPGISCAMLAVAVKSMIASQLRYSKFDVQGEGTSNCVYLVVDVEKAFDRMRMCRQADALVATGLPSRRVATLVTEQMASEVFVRLGDVSVGPVPHSRGKQGGCSTPFAFSAVMAMAIGTCQRRWIARGWGVRIETSSLVGRTSSLFTCAVYADNVILAGPPDQVKEMYRELTSELSACDLGWKPSSFSVLGPHGFRLCLPPVDLQPARTLDAVQSLRWLGHSVCYSADWSSAFDRGFEAATAAWNINRKYFYDRKLSLRSRVLLFSQTAAGVLITHLAHAGPTIACLQRARRWESRCLRALTGLQRVHITLQQFASNTRKARTIASRVGYAGVVESVLQRHFRVAGQWSRMLPDAGDLAMADFAAAWRSQLSSTWRLLQSEGVKRAHAGRPRANWDSLLDSWCSEWLERSACPTVWSAFEDDWIQWGMKRAGVAHSCGARLPPVPAPTGRSEGPAALTLPVNDDDAGTSGVHVLSDNLAIVRVCQGRWKPKISRMYWLCRHSNDLVEHLVALGRPASAAHEGWWIAHVPRDQNGLADGAARHARDVQCNVSLWVLDADAWREWLGVGSAGMSGSSWRLSVDGSMVATPPHAKGLCGAAAVLWLRHGSHWAPVCVAACSAPWAGAAESEAAALHLALALWGAPHVNLVHEFLARCEPRWFSADAWDLARDQGSLDVPGWLSGLILRPSSDDGDVNRLRSTRNLQSNATGSHFERSGRQDPDLCLRTPRTLVPNAQNLAPSPSTPSQLEGPAGDVNRSSRNPMPDHDPSRHVQCRDKGDWCCHENCRESVDACCVACGSGLCIIHFWGAAEDPRTVSRCHEHNALVTCPCLACRGSGVQPSFVGPDPGAPRDGTPRLLGGSGGVETRTRETRDSQPRIRGGSECAMQCCGHRATRSEATRGHLRTSAACMCVRSEVARKIGAKGQMVSSSFSAQHCSQQSCVLASECGRLAEYRNLQSGPTLGVPMQSNSWDSGPRPKAFCRLRQSQMLTEGGASGRCVHPEASASGRCPCGQTGSVHPKSASYSDLRTLTCAVAFFNFGVLEWCLSDVGRLCLAYVCDSSCMKAPLDSFVL